MSLYMIRYQLSPRNRNKAIKRFMHSEEAPTPPDGVTHIDRWHSVAGNEGWHIADATDPKAIFDWVLHWSDIVSYEITPVVKDEELGELLQKHGH